MTLRDELIKVSGDEAFESMSGQLATDHLEFSADFTDDEALVWYRQRLKEYPALERLFQIVATLALNPENSDSVTSGMITGAGLALLGVKAAANRQVFEGLEAPPDLEGR